MGDQEWQDTRKKIRESEYFEKIYHPLALLYCKHIRTLSLMDALKCCNSPQDYLPAPRDTHESVFDNVLGLARPMFSLYLSEN